MSQKYQIFTNVNFKLTGVDEGVQKAKSRIKELSNEVKKWNDELAAQRAEWRKTAKPGDKISDDKEIARIKAQIKAASDEKSKLDAIIKDGARQFNTLRNEIENVENLTARQANVLRGQVAKALANINSLSEGGQQKMKQLAEVLRITTAEIQKYTAGFANMAKPFNQLLGETYGASKDFIKIFETQGHILAKNSEEYRKMAEHAAYSRENIAKIEGTIRVGVNTNKEYTDSLKAMIKEQQRLQQTKGAGVDASNTRIIARQRERELQNELGQTYASRLSNPQRFSTKELQEAMKGAEDWHTYMSEWVKSMQAEYDKYAAFKEKNGSIISEKQFQEAKKELQDYTQMEGEATAAEKKRIKELQETIAKYNTQKTENITVERNEQLLEWQKQQVDTLKERTREEQRYQKDLERTKQLIEQNTKANADGTRTLTEEGSLNMLGQYRVSRSGKGGYFENINKLNTGALQEIKNLWNEINHSLAAAGTLTEEQQQKLEQSKVILKAINEQNKLRTQSDRYTIQQLSDQLNAELKIQETANNTLRARSQQRVNKIAQQTTGILKDVGSYSNAEQEQAMRLAKQLMDSGQLNGTSQGRLSNAYDAAQQFMQQKIIVAELTKQLNALGDGYRNIATRTDEANNESIRYFEHLKGNAAATKEQIAAADEALKALRADQDNKTVAQGNALTNYRLNNLSDSGLRSQINYWTRLRDEWVLSGKDAERLDKIIKRLTDTEKIRKDEQAQQQAIAAWEEEKKKADILAGSYSALSDSALQKLIDKFNDLKETAPTVGKRFNDITLRLEKLNAVMAERKEAAVMEPLERLYMNAEKLSDGTLNKLLQQYTHLREEWEIDGKDASELTAIIVDLEQKTKERAELAAELQAEQAYAKEMAAAERMYKVYTDLSDSGIQNLINKYTRLRDEAEAAGQPTSHLTDKIRELQGELGGRKENTLLNDLQKITDTAGTLSDSTLTNTINQYKKLIEEWEMAGRNADGLKEKVLQLQAVMKARALNSTEDAGINAWFNSSRMLEGSPITSSPSNISEIQQAIKDMEEWRKIMDITTEEGQNKYRAVGETIDGLKIKIREVNGEFEHGAETLAKYATFDEELKKEQGGYGFSAQELKKDKEVLEDYLDKLRKIPDTADEIKHVEDAIADINKELAKPKSFDYWDEFVDDMQKGLKTPKQMKEAISELKKELENMQVGDKEFKKKSELLRDMDRQLKSVNKDLGHHASTLQQAASRLKSYVLIYIGFNQAMQKLGQLISSTKELSDKMTNVQKVAGLTKVQMDRLTDSLQGLDTRVATNQLLELAEAGGKLGLASRGGADALVQFAATAQQVTSTLGEDIGGAEAVADLLKVNDLLNKGATDSLEKQVKRIGSSILEVGNNSKASYGDIVNFTKRVGAIASTAHMTMPQVIALGGTFSALGASMEQAATSTNRLIVGLNTRAREIGRIIGVGGETLQQMVDNGQSFEALMTVLDRIKGSDFQGIEAVLKTIGGKNNTQIKSNTALLTGNIELINQELSLAIKGYSEATLMTMEYNRANENLAGTVQRTKNYISEIFVNAGNTEIVRKFAKMIYDLIRIINELPAAFSIVTSIITAVGFASFGVAAKISTLGKELKALFIAFGTGIKNVTLFITYLTQVIFTAGKASGALQKLKVLMAGNWVTLIATAIAGLIALIYKLATTMSDAAKMAANFTKQLAEDEFSANKLFLALQKGNMAIDEKRRLIAMINDKYGTYLGYMIKESDTADMVAAAHNRVILALRKEAALKMRNKIIDNATEQAAEDTEKALTGLSDRLLNEYGSEKGANLYNKLVSAIARRSSEMQGRQAEEIYKKVEEDMQAALWNASGKKRPGGAKISLGLITTDKWFGDYAIDLIKAQQHVAKQMDNAQAFIDAMDSNARQGERSTLMNEATNLRKDILKRYKASGLDETTAKDLIGRMQAYVNDMTPYLNEKSSAGDNARKYVDLFNGWINNLSKQINKETEDIIGPSTTRSTTRSTTNPLVEQTKKDLGGVMAALEEHFNKRNSAINQAYLNDEITFDEKERELSALEIEHLEARYQLRMALLGRQNTFEQKKYEELNGKNIETVKNNLHLLGEAELDGIAKNAEADKAEMTGKMSEIKHEIETIIEENNPFDKLIDQFATTLFKLNVLIKESEVDILRDTNAMQEAEAKRIAFLMKLAPDIYHLSISAIRDMALNESKDVEDWIYNLTDEEMLAIMNKTEKFSEEYVTAVQKQGDRFARVFDMMWNKQEISIRKGDDGIDRAVIDRISRQEAWDIVKQKGEQDKNVDTRYESIMTPFRTAGGIQESDIDNLSNIQLEIDLLLTKLDLMEQERNAMIAKANLIEDEGKKEVELRRIQEEFAGIEKGTRESLVEARRKQFEAMTEMQNKELEMIRPYFEAMQSFGENFGEAIFGKKEDRQNAAKDLLKTVLTTTKNIIQQYLIDLAMKKFVEQQKRNEEIQTLATEGATTIGDLTATGAKATADVVAGTAAGTAKEVGKLGWKGLVVGALIGTALSALLGLAMSAINKSKSEVSSATGANNGGRMVTGMLTYANGRYPTYADGQYEVDGNDGKRYNARYERNLSTGVYGGGAHFGIFSEKMPEAVIDGRTTQRLVMNYPAIWNDIISLSRAGVLAPGSAYRKRMNTYADGNIGDIAMPDAGGNANPNTSANLEALIAQNNAVMQQLLAQLNAGIKAKVNIPMFGDSSFDSTMTEISKYKQKYGVGK